MKRPLTFGAYLKPRALNSQAFNGKTTTNSPGIKGHWLSLSSHFTKQPPSVLLLLFLLIFCTKINSAQTPLPSPLTRGTSAEQTVSKASISEAPPHPATERPAGGGWFFKRAAHRILRVGEALLNMLAFGEGKNSSSGSTSGASLVPNEPAQATTVRIKINRKQVINDYRVFVYANGKGLEANRTAEGFAIPDEFAGEQNLDVRIVFGKYDLIFNRMPRSTFGERWRVGVDKKPFDEEFLVTPAESRKIRYIYSLGLDETH